MAARENQGLQIALIIFVMLTIALSVTTYLFFDSANKNKVEMIQAQKLASDRETTLGKVNQKTVDYFALIGEAELPADGEEAKVVAKHRDIMAQYIALAGITVKPDNYPMIIAEMAKAVKDKDQKLIAFQEQADKANANLASEQGKFKTEVATVDNDKKELAKKYTDYTSGVDQQIKAIAESKNTAQTQIAKNLEEIEQAKAKDAANTKKYKQEMVTTKEVIKTQRTEIAKFADPKPTLTDGRVIAVDERTKTATVDIGSADSLQRRVTFSVYDSKTNDVGNAVKKGTMEVIEVLGPKLARARILDNSISDPILPGDFIDSTLWYPGKKQKFALAGFIDIDNDGISDRAVVMDLIIANGGTISADVNERGEVTGQVTADTARLVLGKSSDSLLKDAKFQKAWSNINTDADKFSIPKVTLQKFLDEIGYSPAPKFGNDIGGQRLIDTQIKNADGSNNLLNPTFRERTPATPGQKGAY